MYVLPHVLDVKMDKGIIMLLSPLKFSYTKDSCKIPAGINGGIKCVVTRK